MTLDIRSKVIASPEVMFQTVGSEAVLLDLAGETYFGLNEVGARIWQLLEECEQLSVVWLRLKDEYDVDPNKLQQDLLELVRSLVGAGLVCVVDGDDKNGV